MLESALKEITKILDALLEKYNFARAFERKKPPMSPFGYPYATFNRRMMASMIDTCILTLLLIPFNDWIMQVMYKDFYVDPVALDFIMKNAATPQEQNMQVLQLLIDSGLF